MSIRIDEIPNRNSHPQILLRESWREGNRIRHKTLVNLTKLPKPLIDVLKIALKGGIVLEHLDEVLHIQRALPHGHVAAAMGVARALKLPHILDRHHSRNGKLALAAIIARLIEPASKLATARNLTPESATTSLGLSLKLGTVSGNEMLEMLDWLCHRQRHIETALANRHLKGGTLLLYDVSSSYVEGRCCALAAFGYNRDGKRSKRQIVYGLLCNAKGCPIAIEVFEGNTSDPSTVLHQINRIRQRFKIEQVTLVGDRGMLTSARIREDLKPYQLNWISALTSADVKKLLRRHPQVDHQPVLDPQSLVADQVAEVISADFPGERLMVCLNPRRQHDRAKKREQLLAATERVLHQIAAQGERTKPSEANQASMNKALGARATKWKVLKHFDIEVSDDGMSFARNQARIEAEARLDGIYIIRTGLGADKITPNQAVEAYKSLSQVERAFRTIKTDRLQIRPLHVYRETRVRGHVFLCMLAYYLEWHLRRRLAPILFEDEERERTKAYRTSPVATAEVSATAKAKADTKHTGEGLTVFSMDSLMAHLGTLTLNEVGLPSQPEKLYMVTSKMTPAQLKAFELLNIPDKEKVFTVN